MELSYGKKMGLVFGGAFVAAALVLSTIVFPFWNLIREDVYEEVIILNNDGGVCYVETKDIIPKTIENCTLESGDKATIKFGRGLAWAVVVEP
ncbi:MAG: hypothetical protein COW27_01995 [Nitrosopumilales archaeon CG15_BIG_FIL_POST_REV_8_21_14_020_37_12]|nr:MAG: hypothetical protein COW27_01995 [Nitrosopumilales archaeon CG15_BIG_FIL_POST_REV_8_21_14_020_37_12]